MTDRELIHGCLKADACCQRMLFDQFAGRMMTVCLRYGQDRREAEDILQEAFIQVFASLSQFRFLGSLEGWIRRITVNTALRILQHKKIQFSAIGDNTLDHAVLENDALSALSAEEILVMISQLPPGYRLVFNLCVMEGYDHNEIAKMLDINPATSRSQLSKARSLLRTKLEESQKLPHGYE